LQQDRLTPKVSQDPSVPRLVLPSTVEAIEVPTEREMAQHIEARAVALRSGDENLADLELALIEESRLTLAARNVVSVSAELIQEAKVAMELGRLDIAAQRAEVAARLSPDLEGAHWMRVRVYWRMDPPQIELAIGAMKDLLRARFTVFRNQISFLTELLTLFSLAVVASIVAFALLQFLKYVRYPAHDLARKVPAFIGGGEMAILLTALVLMPFGLGFGLAPSLALGIVTVLAYQTTRERVVSAMLLFALAVGPAAIYLAAPLVSFHGSVVDAMAEASSEAFARDAEVRLATRATRGSDYASGMVLAHRLRQRGDLAGAEAAYAKAITAEPQDPAAQNNLGVVLLLRGRMDDAEAAFRRATSNRGGAEPYLNLALLAADRGRFDESSRLMEQARALDPQLVARHTLLSGTVGKKAAVASPSESLLWQQLFTVGREEAPAITAEIWAPMGGSLSPWVSTGVVVIIGLLGVVLVRRATGLSVACPKCGLPARRSTQGQLCDQCKSVYLASIAVEPRLREKKEAAVRRHQFRRRWGERFLAVAAGAGHMVGGRPLAGLLLFFPFVMLALGIWVGEEATVHPWYVFVDEASRDARWVAAGVVMGLLSLLSLKGSFEK
ncbi:MAG: tetratricopeptide repeat protein, partial [Myxococcales bacterium]|nr:tetratricopeptide repeat protein [Myxococcales bacterium]